MRVLSNSGASTTRDVLSSADQLGRAVQRELFNSLFTMLLTGLACTRPGANNLHVRPIRFWEVSDLHERKRAVMFAKLDISCVVPQPINPNGRRDGSQPIDSTTCKNHALPKALDPRCQQESQKDGDGNRNKNGAHTRSQRPAPTPQKISTA